MNYKDAIQYAKEKLASAAYHTGIADNMVFYAIGALKSYKKNPVIKEILDVYEQNEGALYDCDCKITWMLDTLKKEIQNNIREEEKHEA